MKVAVITANVGKFDEMKGIPRQSIEVDFLYYTETNLPFPLQNLDNRFKARYIKTQTHRFLPDYDAYIWLDASVRVNGMNFAESFVEQLAGHDAAFYKHRERKNVYEEMEYIVNEMSKGNDYLVSRYANQQLMKETLFFSKNGLPEDYPLFNCYTFIRRNNERSNRCFDEWWRRCIEFSTFDQAMLSYTAWESNMDIHRLVYDELRTHKLFTKESHLV